MPVEQPLISQWFSSQTKSENEKDQVSKKKKGKKTEKSTYIIFTKKNKKEIEHKQKQQHLIQCTKMNANESRLHPSQFQSNQQKTNQMKLIN